MILTKNSIKLKIILDNEKLILICCGIIVAIVAIITAYTSLLPNSQSIIIDNSENQEDLIIKSNFSAVYTINRFDTYEVFRLNITNVGNESAGKLSINIIFPDNMSIFELDRPTGGQRLENEDGGFDNYYYDVLYSEIYSNETFYFELSLNNLDGDFVVGETWDIEPDYLPVRVSGELIPVIREY